MHVGWPPELLKYLLALFFSSLPNYWFSRQYDNVHINSDYVDNLPVFPAAAQTQSEIVALLDALLSAHRALNVWREAGYGIKAKATELEILVPSGVLMAGLQTQTPKTATLDLSKEIAPDAEVKQPSAPSVELGADDFAATLPEDMQNCNE